MITVSESTMLNHPPERVFEAAADPNTQLQWDQKGMTSVEKLDDGPLAQGSRYRGRFKGFGTVEYEFERYEPPRRFTHKAKMPLGVMHHSLSFEPASGGTRLTQEGRLDPTLLGKIAAPMVRMMLGRRFRLIGDELATYLDRQASGPA